MATLALSMPGSSYAQPMKAASSHHPSCAPCDNLLCRRSPLCCCKCHGHGKPAAAATHAVISSRRQRGGSCSTRRCAPFPPAAPLLSPPPAAERGGGASASGAGDPGRAQRHARRNLGCVRAWSGDRGGGDVWDSGDLGRVAVSCSALTVPVTQQSIFIVVLLLYCYLPRGRYGERFGLHQGIRPRQFLDAQPQGRPAVPAAAAAAAPKPCRAVRPRDHY